MASWATVAKRRYLRSGDALGDADVVVVRGGELDADVLRADAQRYHAVYESYGVSVLAGRDLTVDELAQEPPLVRFRVLTLVQVGVLRAAGLRLDPPQPSPFHARLRRPRRRDRPAPPLRTSALAQPVP